MTRKAVAFELAVVVLLALVLVVEWWRAGELEDLDSRVDALELDLRARRSRRRPAAAPKPEVTS